MKLLKLLSMIAVGIGCSAAAPASNWHFFRGDAKRGEPAAMILAFASDAVFGAKCDTSGPHSLYLEFSSGHGAPHEYADRDMEWRFDRGEFQLSQWTYQGGTAFTADQDTVRYFLRGLADAHVVTIRSHPRRGVQVDTVIDAIGAKAAIGQLKHACTAP